MPTCRTALIGLLAGVLAGCAAAPVDRTAPVVVSTPPAQAGTADNARMRELATRVHGARPAFRNCVDQATTSEDATRSCVQAELHYQQTRIDSGLAARRLKSTSNGSVDTAQAQWAAERDRICGADGAGATSVQRVQSAICRLEITIARADVLAQ